MIRCAARTNGGTKMGYNITEHIGDFLPEVTMPAWAIKRTYGAAKEVNLRNKIGAAGTIDRVVVVST